MNLKPISKYLKNGSCKRSPCNSPLYKAPLSVTNPQKQPVFSIQEPEIKITLDPNRSQLIPELLGPSDLRPTRLNCILQDLFRDTPLDHIARAQICQIWPNMQNVATNQSGTKSSGQWENVDVKSNDQHKLARL